MTHPLEELAERVERAEGPSLVLDRDIALAIYPGAKPVMGNEARISVWDGNGRTQMTVKPYSASLDAAMTLMPNESYWRTGNDADDPSALMAQVSYERPGGIVGFCMSLAETAPLAMVAASLRARAAVEEG